MNYIEEKIRVRGYECTIEFEHDDQNYFPIKISVFVKIKDGEVCHSEIFSNVTFATKEDCVKFLRQEIEKFIINDLEI